MEKGVLQVYCGSGKGKTTAALGQAIKEASNGKSVFIIQFLKGRQQEQLDFIQRLEPEIKMFRFERHQRSFEELTEQEKEEETRNMKNGLCFARKVLSTGECDVLILDEILGLLEYGIAGLDDIQAVLDEVEENMEVIFTGVTICPEVMEWADCVYEVKTLKE